MDKHRLNNINKKKNLRRKVQAKKNFFEKELLELKEKYRNENVEIENCETNELNNDEVSQEIVDHEEEHLWSDCLFSDDNESSSESKSEYLKQQKHKDEILKQKLKIIVVEHNVSVVLCRKLLFALRCYGINLPKTRNGLLKTESDVEPVIRKIPGGEYLHIGIETNTIECNETDIIKAEQILIDIGIDGLPLFKSSMTCIWPILGSYVNYPQIEPFIIGVFLGKGHPKSPNEFMKDFCDEVVVLKNKGIEVSKKKLIKPFNVRAFCCDAPAKSFITNTKHHNSLHGCQKCTQQGISLNNRTVYNKFTSTLRSDDSFKKKTDAEYHQTESLNSELYLEKIGIKMVTQFVLDSMHLIDLGVTKKMLTLFLSQNKKLKTRMSEDYIQMIPFIPKEFSRKPRSFEELPRFKATEFRQIVMYTGITLFKKYFSDEMYEHFLSLCCACRILNDKKN